MISGLYWLLEKFHKVEKISQVAAILFMLLSNIVLSKLFCGLLKTIEV